MDRDAKNGLFDYFVAESQKFKNYVHSRIRNISDMDAEDIVGEVMLGMFKRSGTAVSIENLGAYVYRSLRNKIVDYHRQKSRTVSLQSCISEDTDVPFAELLADSAASVSTEAERKEFMRHLSGAISKLEPKQRAVFIATEMKGLSFKTLCEQWNEPVGTLLSRKFRAVKALQEMLKDFKPL